MKPGKVLVRGLSFRNRKTTRDDKYYAVRAAGGALNLEDCEVFNNGFANISVKESADPRITNSRIYNSKSSGVYFYQNAKGRLEDSNIYGNTYSGVSSSEGANPFVNRCKINRNGHIETGSTVRPGGNTQ